MKHLNENDLVAEHAYQVISLDVSALVLDGALRACTCVDGKVVQ